ncbi:hypothetical protein DTL42_09710 [Bremerella cremea]|uniref:Uncharacterized protein n=1 Tax=Bremerella cremea TaxID=1031537 RepID=A0A368KW69_9BACT|nr:hypothetical protein [Bremerella cremea]RCS51936.1 hypothetical protein DTL42_09710 [Bremerella cremea]
MIIRSFQEVVLDQLPDGVLQKRSRGRFGVKFSNSAFGIFIRVAMLLGFVGLPIWSVFFGDEMARLPPSKWFGVLGFIASGIFVGAYFPAVVIDVDARCVSSGYMFFNCFPIVMFRYPVDDTDRVQIRVTDNHFGERHNPVYQVVIRRPGRYGAVIVLIEVVFPPEDPLPKLRQFGNLVGQLLSIELDEEINSDGMKGSMPEYN